MLPPSRVGRTGSPARRRTRSCNVRIALVGEALIDFAGQGDLAFQGHVGGSPLNAAVACARLGQPTGYLTQLAEDLLGDRILRHLEENGVDTRFVTRADGPTTLAFVARVHTTNRYVFYARGSADSRWAPCPLPTLPPEVAFLHFGSISLLQEPAASAIEGLVAANAGRRVLVLDPNVRPSQIAGPEAYRARFARWLGSADLLKLSDEDLAYLAPGRTPADAAAAWLGSGPRVVVVTEGAAGATLYAPGRRPLHVPAFQVALSDTIGAGDTFTAGLLAGLLERGVERAGALAELGDEEWGAVLRFAAAAAALDCTRPGCDPPRRGEVAAFLGGT
jgi:fructokinase